MLLLSASISEVILSSTLHIHVSLSILCWLTDHFLDQVKIFLTLSPWAMCINIAMMLKLG